MKRIISLLLVATSLASCGTKNAQQFDYGVIPQPTEIQLTPEAPPFRLDGHTSIIYARASEQMAHNATLLQGYIFELTGIQPALVPVEIADTTTKNTIVLATGHDSQNAEAYRLTVETNTLRITGASEAGVFYGIQTLRKSLPIGQTDGLSLPAAIINDQPRFAWRGMMLDCARHFFSKEFVKRYIDLLALHNCNRFHWHLSDDQGWRIEIKQYPKLTEIGSHRSGTVLGRNTDQYDSIPLGGFYTQEDVREIVAYAAERYITIIPEIDMPGHMLAALASYPELGCRGKDYEVWKRWGVAEEVLCAGKESTFEFASNVLEEIMDLFPSKIIHIGGDECPKTAWEHCPLCQARIRAEGLRGNHTHTPEQQLQSYFMRRMAQVAAARGRQVIGWDEILEGGAPERALIMSWRGEEGGLTAARLGHDVVMVPNNKLYFDYYQTKDVDREPLAIGGYIPVESVYAYQPIPAGLTPEQQRHIIGLQANLWTEYIPTTEQVEYMVLPRMAALCEVQWCAGSKDYDHFLSRLPHQLDLYTRLGYNYAKHLMRVETSFGVDTTTKTVTVNLKDIDHAPIRYTLDGSEPTDQSPLYENTLHLARTTTLRTIAIRNGEKSEENIYDIRFSLSTACPVTLLTAPNPTYHFAGGATLTDGLQGNKNYRTGRWIGLYGNDLQAIIDLSETHKIARVALQVCVNKDDGCFDARNFSVEVSPDNVHFTPVASEQYRAMTEQDAHGVYAHELKFTPTPARFVRITLGCEHQIPEWHPMHGAPAFLFADEITVE